jgi:hypothetical protein
MGRDQGILNLLERMLLLGWNATALVHAKIMRTSIRLHLACLGDMRSRENTAILWTISASDSGKYHPHPWDSRDWTMAHQRMLARLAYRILAIAHYYASPHAGVYLLDPHQYCDSHGSLCALRSRVDTLRLG